MKHLLKLLTGILVVGIPISIIWLLATFKILAISAFIIAALVVCYLIGLGISEDL